MGRSVRRLTGLSAVAAVLAAIPAAAAAVEPLDTFSVSIGGYVTRFDTRVRADGELFGGTTIDLSRDLGLDKDDMIGFLGVSWRPFARHEVGLADHYAYWVVNDEVEAAVGRLSAIVAAEACRARGRAPLG